MENHNWYAVITAKVLLAKDLTHSQKLLMALISNLSNEKGYCFASNAYLGEMIGLNKDTISRLLSDLEKKGHLGNIIYRNEKKQIESRFLTIIERPENNPIPMPKNEYTPIHEKSDTPILKNVKGNNIVYNNKVLKEKENIKEKEDFYRAEFEQNKTQDGIEGYASLINHIFGKNDDGIEINLPLLSLEHQISFANYKKLLAKSKSLDVIKDKCNVFLNSPHYAKNKKSVYLTINNWL